jgi:hypothetical protein
MIALLSIRIVDLCPCLDRLKAAFSFSFDSISFEIRQTKVLDEIIEKQESDVQ